MVGRIPDDRRGRRTLRRRHPRLLAQLPAHEANAQLAPAPRRRRSGSLARCGLLAWAGERGQGVPPWRGVPLFVAAARGSLRIGLALVALFFGLVALYAFIDPVSTLMLARTVEGGPYDRFEVRSTPWRRPRSPRWWPRSARPLRQRRRRLGGASRGARLSGTARAVSRRLHADHADGQEPLSLAGPLGGAQGAGDPDGARSRRALAEAAGDEGLSQHRRMGRRDVWDRGRGAALFP